MSEAIVGDGIERRMIVQETELRLLAPPVDARGTSVGTIVGYAAVYGKRSAEMGSAGRRFVEQIAPGAFRSALMDGGNTFAFFNHGVSGGIPNAAMPLGSTQDGSLRMKDDGIGLRFELDLPDTSDGRDLAALVQRGTVRGVSFGFPNKSISDTWHRDGQTMVRTLHEVRKIGDISPTHMPAYPDTTLALRSLDTFLADEADKVSRSHAAETEAADLAAATERRKRRTRLLEIDAGIERRSVDKKNEDAADGGADDDMEMRASDAERPDSDFAAVYEEGEGDKKTKVRKLPIYDAGHVRNALARWDQTDLPDGEKAAARKRLEAAAKKFGIGDY